MPHPKHRKPETRRRILAAAAQLFAARGYEATSIDEVMRACGLTRGGFYAHFRSKAQLHDEAVAHAHATGRSATATDWLEALFDTCTTPHDTAPSALWASLALDVGSSTPEVRRGYARTLSLVCERLRDELAGSSRSADAALAVTAMLVGSLAVAQTVDDAALRADMAEACREAAQALRQRPRADDTLHFFWSVADEPHAAHAVH